MRHSLRNFILPFFLLSLSLPSFSVECDYKRLANAGIVYELPPEEPEFVNRAEITESDSAERFAALKVSPYYQFVWVSPNPKAHLQAIVRSKMSAKPRYLYHPDWYRIRSEEKFERMEEFGEALADLRASAAEDLKAKDLSQNRISAAIALLMDQTAVRVGNRDNVKEHKTYGLTTLLKKHVTVKGSTVQIEPFVGKAGKTQTPESVVDADLAQTIRELLKRPGPSLFPVSDHQFNHYLKEKMGDEFSAKDFRTWKGTVTAFAKLHEFREAGKVPAKADVADAIAAAAQILGNTPAVSKEHYVHPEITRLYLENPEKIDKAYAAAKKKKAENVDETALLILLGGK